MGPASITSMLVLAREQPAVDAVGPRGIIEHEVAYPVTIATRGGVLEGLVLEIVRHHLTCALILEDLGGARSRWHRADARR